MSDPTNPLDHAAAELLGDLKLWRLRAIERVELSGAFWSERQREIHVHPFNNATTRGKPLAPKLKRTLDALKEHDDDNEITLILPITELPKIPLLDLSITVAGVHVYRVSRDEGARIQALHVIALATAAKLIDEKSEKIPPLLVDFLTFIFYFPSESYERVYHRFKRSIHYTPSPPFDSQFMYIYPKLSSKPDLLGAYPAWRKISDRISKEMIERHALHDPLSGSQNPLITLPYFLQEMAERGREDGVTEIPTEGEITKLLEYLVTILEDAHLRPKEDRDAHGFISTYFAYGHRWMAFAKCTVPIHKPFIIKVNEKRMIYFTPHRDRRRLKPLELLKKEAYQMLAFNDAETNHVNIRISDTSVRMKRNPKILDNQAEVLKDEQFELDDEKVTFEFYLRQDSYRERPDRIFIKCPLRLTRIQSGMLWLTMAITTLAWFVLLNRGISDAPFKVNPEYGIENNLTAKDATLVLVPVAFAAALLLSKHDSTLSAWIRKIRQAVLLIELGILLVTAFVLLLIHHVRIG